MALSNNIRCNVELRGEASRRLHYKAVHVPKNSETQHLWARSHERSLIYRATSYINCRKVHCSIDVYSALIFTETKCHVTNIYSKIQLLATLHGNIQMPVRCAGFHLFPTARVSLCFVGEFIRQFSNSETMSLLSV